MFFHYQDSLFYYRDISNFWYTTVYYSEHVNVMSYVISDYE